MKETNHISTVLNWSSGKDAALAYHLLQQDNRYTVTHLLTTVSADTDRVVMHGIREQLLDAQAERMNVILKKVKLPASPDNQLYNEVMRKALSELKDEGVQASAFGDIFLEDLKAYREQQLQKAGVEAMFPLWKKDTVELVKMVEATGIEAIIVCVNDQYLGKEFLGRLVDENLLKDLPANVDPCGENGEFHTYVKNAPFFTEPVPVLYGDAVHKVYKNEAGKWDAGFWFLDLYL